MNVSVEPFVRVQLPMHPVDPNFDNRKVGHHRRNVPAKSPDFVNSKVGIGPTIVNNIFVHHGKQDVQKHTRLRQFDLVPNDCPRRSRTSHLFKDFIADGMDVAEVVKSSGHSVVEENGSNKIANITENIMRRFQ